MPSRPPLEIRLPKRRPWPWFAVLGSVVFHSLLLFGWVSGRMPTIPRLPRQLIVLAPPSEGPHDVPMRYQLPRAQDERRGRQLGENRTGRVAERAVRPEPPAPVRTLPSLPERKPERLAADTGTAPRTTDRRDVARLGPGLAQGKLWVRPLPLPPKELAQRLSRTHAQLADSAVTAIVQAYLDSIANDPASKNQELPSWTTQIAGKKFGLDSKHIYIAGLKIPAAVLALIPIPAGNIDQNRAYNHLMDLRADLMYAAQRAQNMEEFKIMIRQMRERKEREREFEKNQRTAPPPQEPPTP